MGLHTASERELSDGRLILFERGDTLPVVIQLFSCDAGWRIA